MKIKPEKREFTDREILTLKPPFELIFSQFVLPKKVPYYKQIFWKMNAFIIIGAIASFATYQLVSQDSKTESAVNKQINVETENLEKMTQPVISSVTVPGFIVENSANKQFYKNTSNGIIVFDDTIPIINDTTKLDDKGKMKNHAKKIKGVEFFSTDDNNDESAFYFLKINNFSFLKFPYAEEQKKGQKRVAIANKKTCFEKTPLVQDERGNYGLLDSAGNELVTPKYITIDCFDNYWPDWALVQDNNGYYGFINSDGAEIVPTIYITIDKFGKYLADWALVQDNNGYYGFINNVGKEVGSTQYLTIDKFGKYLAEWALVQDNNGHYGFINNVGQEVVSTQYLTIDKFGKYLADWALVQDNNGYYGFINNVGQEVVPTQYLTIDKFGKYLPDWALVQDNNGYYGFINSEGKEIVSTEYTTVYKFDQHILNYMVVEKEGLFGLISKDGKVKIKPKYISISQINVNDTE
jgi:hypothetical protein